MKKTIRGIFPLIGDKLIKSTLVKLVTLPTPAHAASSIQTLPGRNERHETPRGYLPSEFVTTTRYSFHAASRHECQAQHTEKQLPSPQSALQIHKLEHRTSAKWKRCLVSIPVNRTIHF